MLFLQNRNNTDDFDINIVKTISPKDDSSKRPLFLTKLPPQTTQEKKRFNCDLQFCFFKKK